MKSLLLAILSHRREMTAVREAAGFPCPMGGVQEARDRVTSAALDLPHVEAWLAWVEAVERTENTRLAILNDPTVPLGKLPPAIEAEAEALARLRVAMVRR